MSASPLQTRVPELSQCRRFLVLAICCASIVVVVMDISIVNVALPAMRRDLHASVSGLQWTVDAYTLVLAGFLLLAGSSADRVGRRRILQVGLAVFGLGSLLCGLAPSVGWLVAAAARQYRQGLPIAVVVGLLLLSPRVHVVERCITKTEKISECAGVEGELECVSAGAENNDNLVTTTDVVSNRAARVGAGPAHDLQRLEHALCAPLWYPPVVVAPGPNPDTGCLKT